jgi:hypothetical protein
VLRDSHRAPPWPKCCPQMPCERYVILPAPAVWPTPMPAASAPAGRGERNHQGRRGAVGFLFGRRAPVAARVGRGTRARGRGGTWPTGVRSAEHQIHTRRPRPTTLAWGAIYGPNSPNRALKPDGMGLTLPWWPRLAPKLGQPGVRGGRLPLHRPTRGAMVRVQGGECSGYLPSI